MSNFIPDGYEEPKMGTGGTYFRLNDKEQNEQTKRIRIMGSFENPNTAIMGWESWKEGQPYRFRYVTGDQASFEKAEEIDEEGRPRHFWAIQIFNLDDQEAQIWSITQRTIQKQLRKLAENDAWGNPINYVIAVTRTGHGLQTEYNLVAEPPVEPPSEDLKNAMLEAQINISEFFEDEGRGRNPFGALQLTNDANDGMPF
tara:strand:- start:4942 stop:5541 length:600 start_codon:yes stop_codon:yes gene_type:complete